MRSITSETTIVSSLIKRLLIVWDPDFTKVTPRERKTLEEADREMEAGEYILEQDVWKD